MTFPLYIWKVINFHGSSHHQPVTICWIAGCPIFRTNQRDTSPASASSLSKDTSWLGLGEQKDTESALLKRPFFSSNFVIFDQKNHIKQCQETLHSQILLTNFWCPFDKNRGAGDWLIPSIIKQTCCFPGGFEQPPLSFHQPTNGNLRDICADLWASLHPCAQRYRPLRSH